MQIGLCCRLSAVPVFGLFLTASVLSGAVIGVNLSGDVYDINPGTGSSSLVAAGSARGNSLARNAAGQFVTSDGLQLIAFDPLTGTVTHSGPTITGLGANHTNVIGMAFQPGTDTLFISGAGFANGLGTGGLYTVNVATGTATLVGSTAPSQPVALAFSPEGILYGWANFRGLTIVDTVTGAVTDVNPDDNGTHPGIQAIAFDPETGFLYGARDEFYSIDLATGLATLIGGSLNDIRGIEFTPDAADVPEPGSLFLLAGGLAGLALIRRKRLITA